MAKMYDIPPMTVVFTARGRFISSREEYRPKEPHYSFVITPSEDGKEIAHIDSYYRSPRDSSGEYCYIHELFAEEEVLGQMENWLETDIPSYIGSLSRSELERIASSYDNSVRVDAAEILLSCQPTTLEERVWYLFLSGLASYLGLLSLLTRPEGPRDNLPFLFSLPVALRSGETLCHNLFRYIEIPLSAMAKITEGPLRFLLDCILEFFNVWSSCFVAGADFDTQRITAETISGYAASILAMGERVKEAEARLHQAQLQWEERIEREMQQRLSIAIEAAISSWLQEHLPPLLDQTITQRAPQILSKTYSQTLLQPGHKQLKDMELRIMALEHARDCQAQEHLEKGPTLVDGREKGNAIKPVTPLATKLGYGRGLFRVR